MNDEIRDTGMAIAGIRVALNDLKRASMGRLKGLNGA